MDSTRRYETFLMNLMSEVETEIVEVNRKINESSDSSEREILYQRFFDLLALFENVAEKIMMRRWFDSEMSS